MIQNLKFGIGKYTLRCSFKKYTFHNQEPLNFADAISNQHLLAKIVPLQKKIVGGLLEIF